ncbi:MAG: hypothetical protein E7508_01305 [Ruminococcus sp.]|nr:hypothetical protein [Ruminococcus sp.]
MDKYADKKYNDGSESMTKKTITRLSALIFSAIMILSLVNIPIRAEDKATTVTGKVYEFNAKSKYEISTAENYVDTTQSNTYGEFLLDGNIKVVPDKDGIPAYEIIDGELSLIYKYDDALLNAEIDSWHLYSDATKEIDGNSVGEKIQNGTIWLQTSMDKKNWTNAFLVNNAFSITPNNSDSFYIAKDIELINGCYYKLVIAYETRIRTEDSNFLMINTDKFDYKKYAEVYEFYAYTDVGKQQEIDYEHTYNIGSKVRVKDFDGYYGQEDIKKDDIHYGWDLGNFFISGYTDKRANDDGDVVFLKNTGDKVTLWFNLAQDLNSLNGNKELAITKDSEGYDQYFETPRIDFGKGTMIIRHTDHNNNKSEPQIYTNYLEANTSFGANTKVQLFEEGDYEVALDYEVTKNGIIDNIGHYRIFFKFSVRNGNCMFYTFDTVTGSELSNCSITENGFRLDLANSKYLNVNVKREVLKDSADGLVEDTRFNALAKDGAEYTDEGIYTITVSNQYVDNPTVRKIYVGTNDVLRAHVITGKSIPEIIQLVDSGATIREDGTIKEPVITETETATETTPIQETVTEMSVETSVVETEEIADVMANVDNVNSEHSVTPIVITILIVAVVCAVVIVVIVIKKKNDNLSTDDERGAE